MRAYTERLLHFVSDAPRSDRAVRSTARDHVVEAMTPRAPVSVWIVDDTGMLKQGTHSVGVQRDPSATPG